MGIASGCQLADLPANHTIAREAGMARVRIVHFEDAPIHRQALLVVEKLVECEAFRHVLEEQTVLLLARGQLLFSPAQLGDILNRDSAADHLAFPVRTGTALLRMKPRPPSKR